MSVTRSLDRAIDVIDALAAARSLSLHELHANTGLAKTTLRRLLATLVARKLVRLGLSDGRYRLNVALSSAPSATFDVYIARLIDAAERPIKELAAQLHWPVDIHAFEVNRMRIVESTYPASLRPYGDGVELELNLFAAASGLAFLSCLSRSRLDHILESTVNDEAWGMRRYGLSTPDLLKELAQIRRNGYAVRRTSQVASNRFTAVSVPILSEGDCAGTIAVWWPIEIMSLDRFIQSFAPALRNAVLAIEGSLQAI
jgi:IclR family mhp operon transcriptional activator